MNVDINNFQSFFIPYCIRFSRDQQHSPCTLQSKCQCLTLANKLNQIFQPEDLRELSELEGALIKCPVEVSDLSRQYE